MRKKIEYIKLVNICEFFSSYGLKSTYKLTCALTKIWFVLYNYFKISLIYLTHMCFSVIAWDSISLNEIKIVVCNKKLF